MITGAHVVLHTPEADALRAVLRDVMGWSYVDVHDGWLIFALPPAEVGVHPGDSPRHELTLMCDDIHATVADLREKGIRADTILRELAAAAGGKGGGKPHMAQAGIPDAERMASVVAEAPDLIRKHLASAG